VCGPEPEPDSFRQPHKTSACSGGLRYRPTMSSTFSLNNGSLLSLKVRNRSGFSPCLFQIRRTQREKRAGRARVRKTVNYLKKEFEVWLGGRDSNPDKQSQSLLSYR
jgi:hypothetical protein